MSITRSIKRREMATAKLYRKGARLRRRQNLITKAKHGRSYAMAEPVNARQAHESMRELETNGLSPAPSHATVESPIAKKTEPEEESTLSWFCRTHGIRTFPKNPAEELRGLLSEFNIEESAVDIVRDIRDNP